MVLKVTAYRVRENMETVDAKQKKEKKCNRELINCPNILKV